MSSHLSAALVGIPESLRDPLIETFLAVKRRHREGKHDAAGVAAGRFAEVALRVVQQAVTGAYLPLGQRIPNFADDCRKLITHATSSAPEAVRVIVPRALVFLYTMRNKRGIGHVGGDVDANAIDLETMVRVADWIVCEFVRVFHGLSLEEAQAIVDALAEREVPDIWEVNGRKRVLRAALTKPDQALLLLYSEPDRAVPAEDLLSWVEYTSFSMFRARILEPLHKRRLIEFDDELRMVFLSPAGARHVEAHLLIPSAASGVR